MLGGLRLGLADDEGVFDGEVGGVVAEIGHFGGVLKFRCDGKFVELVFRREIEGLRVSVGRSCLSESCC